MAEVTPQNQTPPAIPPASATPPPPQTNWYDGAKTEMQTWLSNKQFKSPLDAAESAWNLEKLMGVPQDRIIKLADKTRGDDGNITPEFRSILERLGAPKAADEYQIEIPKEHADPKMADAFRRLFFEEGIPKASAEKIVKNWNDYQAKQLEGFKEQAKLAATNAELVLKKDWGAAYDQNLNIAKEAVKVLGLNETQLNALHNSMGQEGAMKLMHKLGVATGESRFVQGGHANQAMTPDQAKLEIKSLMADKDFVRRVSTGEKEAVDRWTRVNMQAAPGEYQLGQMLNRP